MQNKTLELIEKSQEIIDSYPSAITIRQLYYRLVSKLFIENNMKQYKRLVSVMTDARMKGLISYDSFIDRGREFTSYGDRTYWESVDYFESQKDTYENAESKFKDSDSSYWLPKWHLQPVYVEVFCEKSALTGVFEPVCSKKSVVYGAARGQPSITWLYDASNRITNRLASSHVESAVVLVYSDFDPSGLSIFETIRERLTNTFGVKVDVIQKAILEPQITKYGLSPMPTKLSDSKAKKWIAEHGAVSCVELDAIDPPDLEALIENDIMSFWDSDASDNRDIEIKDGAAEIKELIEDYL